MFMERTLGDVKYIIDELSALVPMQGACEFPRSKNKSLDKFRRATNCVYDFFNNGLMNRRYQFIDIFGPAPTMRDFSCFSSVSWDQWEDRIEPMFRKIIMDAAEEQGIEIRPTYLDLYKGE